MSIKGHSRSGREPVESLKTAVRDLGSFPYFEMATDDESQKVEQLIYCKPLNREHLEEIKELISRGWEPLSPWELADHTHIIERRMRHIEDPRHWAVISKYPAKNKDGVECVLVLFKSKSQTHLEYLPINQIWNVIKHPVFVLAKKTGPVVRCIKISKRKK